MKAQISVEFLLNFLLMLALISVLITAFSHLFVSAKIHSARILEKTKLEEFTRFLDVSATICNEKFSTNTITDKYSIEDVDNEGVVISEINGKEIRSFSIYRIDNNGEPI